MFQAASLRQAHTLRPLTTAHLAQTMALLELTAAELRQKIEAELAHNPALELREERRCPICQHSLKASAPCPRCTIPKTLSPDDPIVFVSPREDFYPSRGISPEDATGDSFTPASEDLPTYVLRQIAPDLQPDERRIASHLLTNLNADGLLEIPLSEVVRYHHVSLGQVEHVLRLIQRAEPVGVGSSSPQDALLIQLEMLDEGHPGNPWIPAAREAVRQGMDLLSRRQYTELGQLLGVSSRDAQHVARFIADNLNPYPARAHWGDLRSGNGSNPPVYTDPDAIITCFDDSDQTPLVVEIAAPYSGILQVNPLFRQALNEAPPALSGQWESDLQRAELLVKCLQQRNNTVVRLMRRISILQRGFILHGDQHLQPMTRARLAKELAVHESTISRAVASKTVQMPNGHIIPLAKFFDRSLHIRTVIKEIIEAETRPYSDSEIVEMLAEQGYSIARRTVAKYRSMEGILPSHLRQSRCSMVS